MGSNQAVLSDDTASAAVESHRGVLHNVCPAVYGIPLFTHHDVAVRQGN